MGILRNIKEEVIPLIGEWSIRPDDNVSANDYGIVSKYKNVYFDIITTGTGQEAYIYPREGSHYFSTSSNEPTLGIHYWSKVDSMYGISGSNLVYTNTFNPESVWQVVGAIPGTPSTNAGVWFEEYYNLTNDYLLFKYTWDGVSNKLYFVTTGGVITQVTDSVYTSLTSYSRVVAMDGYVFVGTLNGGIYNSNLNDITVWNSLAFINAQESPDKLITIFKSGTYLVAFGEYTTEFFENAGNPPPASPLVKNLQLTRRIGIVRQETLQRVGDDAYFVGHTASGGRGIYKISGSEIKKVSPTVVDNALSNTSITTAGVIGFAGHLFYIVPTTTTFSIDYIVYDITNNTWPGTWSGDYILLSGKGQNTAYSQRVGNADIFIAQMGSSRTGYYGFGGVTGSRVQYTDLCNGNSVNTGASIPVLARTEEYDLRSNKRKFITSLELIGRLASTSNTTTVKIYADGNLSTASYTGTVDFTTGRRILFPHIACRTVQLEISYSTLSNSVDNKQPILESVKITYEEGTS